MGWAEDASNGDAGASRRNAVRLRLVPLLQQLTGGALDARLADAAAQSAALREMLDATPRVWSAGAAADDACAVDGGAEEDGWALEGDADGDDDARDALCAAGELDLPRRACVPCAHSHPSR